MLKLIKRLFFLSLILLIGGAMWGFNNGMTKDNYQEFISEVIAKYQQEEPRRIDEEPTIVKEKELVLKPNISTKPKSKKKKKQKQRLMPLPPNPFAIIDKHARNSSSLDEVDIKSLASYLQQKTHTDLEKSRAIYVWIAENILYDDEAFNSGNYPTYTPTYLLENRKAVCEGFSNLYLALGLEMGLEIEKVVGYSKGYSYEVGSKLDDGDRHAWNIIKINGEWKVFDATWGQGYGKNVGGKLVSTKKFKDYWFNVDQYEAIFNHYPESEEFQFVRPAISLSQYEQMPNIDNEYFALGFSGKETFLAVNSNLNYQTPKSYDGGTHVKVIKAPRVNTLYVNQDYYFDLYIPRADKVAVIDSKGNWTNFERDNGRFRLNFTPKEVGNLQVSLHHKPNTEYFDTVLIYEVSENDEAL